MKINLIKYGIPLPNLLKIFFISCLIFFFTCSKKSNKSLISEDKIDTILPPKVTILAELPDSLQPVITYLDEVPKPITKTITFPPPIKTFIDSVTGQPLPPELHGKGFFTNYTAEDGLANDVVHSTYIDRTGHFWFATVGGGVSRYDGKSFTSFTSEHGLASNYVWEILEDTRGNIWIGTFGGVSRYDGRTFTNFTTSDGLPVNDIEAIEEDNAGNIWIASHGGGVSRYDGKSFTNFTEADGLTCKYVFSIEKDRTGKLWFGTACYGVLQYDATLPEGQGRFTVLQNEHGWDGIVITCIHEDHAGNLWFGTTENGLIKYDGKAFTYYNTTHGIGENYITDILEDRSGTLWVATFDGGLSRFNGKTFVTFTTEEGLGDNNLTSITEDDAGNLWIGTYGGGVSCYHGKAFTNFIVDPVNENVVTITEDIKGNLWFGTNELGIARYDGKSVTSFTTAHGLSDNNNSFVKADSKGRMWFTSSAGTSFLVIDSTTELLSQPVGIQSSSISNLNFHNQIQQARMTTFTPAQGLVDHGVRCIEEDKQGVIWFGTYGGGVSRFDGKSFTTFTTTQGLISNEIQNILIDTNGNFWFTSMGSEGVSLYDGKSFTNFTVDQGLADITGGCISEDKSGNIWLGTTTGLHLLTVEKLDIINKHGAIHAPLFQIFGTKDGLPDISILQIIADNEGNLIICTLSGIALLKGGLNAFETPGAIEIFSIKNGFPLRDAFPVFKDSKNIIWIGSGSDKVGLARFDPNAIHKSKEPPVVVIQKIKINSESMGWYSLSRSLIVKSDSTTIPAYMIEESHTLGRQRSEIERDSMRDRFEDIKFDSISSWYPTPINLVLPYRHNSIVIDFNAIITTRNHLVRYQFMLEGYDKHWNPITENSSATFGNIHEGHYTFKVKARSPDGVWSEPISYSFRVLPPLHKTWWAYSLYGLLFISLMYSGHRYQKQRTIRKEQEKSKQKQAILNERLRISRDLHDEVGATLSGIVMYSHLAKTQANDGNQEVKHSLNIVQETASEMVNKLNDVVWLVNPEQDNLEKLIEKLEDYAGKVTESQNIEFKINMPEKLDSISLPIDVRKNIYLFCKEALNNAVKYSGGTLIEFGVSRKDHDISFTIKDNGIGFETETVKRGNGLNNLKQRAEEIGADFILSTKPGMGALLQLKYKIT